jgi:predicted GNAT family acetyltransferase
MESRPESPFVTHNESKKRFEVALGGRTAFAEYRVEGDRMIFTHTEVPPPFRGRGIAKRIVLAGFDAAARNNLRIVPLCSYVARVLGEHPQFISPEKSE